MTRHVFNPSLPKLGETLEQPAPGDLIHVPGFKYADLDYVMGACENRYVRYVLGKMPIFNKHKRILVDVKLHKLKRGQVPCVPGWHLDGSINPEDLPKQPETLTLFVTGQHALTKFLAKPIELDVKDSWDFAVMNRACASKIPAGHPTWTMPSCTFGTYDDHYFHTGVAATGDERRILIRTTETDIIKPRNQIYTPYTHEVGAV